MKSIFFLILMCLPFLINAQTITTANSMGVGDVNGVVFDSYGNLYFTTLIDNQVKKMDTNYLISVVAGNGTAGFSGDNSLATNAELNQPCGIAIDSAGNLIVADVENNRIRKIDITTGIITTIAGTGYGAPLSGGYSGDGGLATDAELFYPATICFDKSWNLYIADGENYRIRKINTSGIISTYAGTGSIGSNGDGGPATSATCWPSSGIVVDNVGNLYFTQTITYPTIRKVDTSGIISTIAGDTISHTYNGDGIPAIDAYLCAQWLSISSDGLLYISDEANNARIRIIDNSGIIHTVAGVGINGHSGDGGPADSAEIYPTGLAFDSCGNLFFGEVTSIEDIRKVAFNPYCWPEKVPQIINTEVVIYPNPTTNEINIDNVQTGEKYSLFNVTGIIVQTGILQQGNNNINIQYLPPGIYILEMMDEEGNKTIKKIVKE